MVERLFLTVPRGCLQFVIVVFPDHTHLLFLSKRMQQHKLSFMYKVNNGIVPSYIQDLIPALVSEISNYPLRNNRNMLRRKSLVSTDTVCNTFVRQS